MPKVKIIPIENLLRLHALKNSLRIAILFVTTKPNYYNFGSTLFYQLNIADTDAPVIKEQDMRKLKDVLHAANLFETIYVCCDAGLSRSPAVACFLAAKLKKFEQVVEIMIKYRFLNQALYEKLMEK